MKITMTGIEGLFVLEPDRTKDYIEQFSAEKIKEIDNKVVFVQDNQSMSHRGVVRGMHFQTKFPYVKLIYVLQGSIYDVAVDLRKDSKTYKKWYGIELNGKNHKQLYIPTGFAHGFMALSDYTIVNFKVTEYYHPDNEMGFIWNDRDIGISWPDEIKTIILAEKDKKWPDFNYYRN